MKLIYRVLPSIFIADGVLFAGCSRTPDWSPFPFIWAPFSFIWGVLGLAIYFLPTILALVMRKRNAVGIILLNIFLGWTFIGWVIALVWALTSPQEIRS